MKKCLLACIFLIPAISNASENLEKSYLLQILNQLEATKPLILAASKEQLPHLRVQFHYKAYQDYRGVMHNGLFEDINEIEKGIQDKLSQISSEPHQFESIKGDYDS